MTLKTPSAWRKPVNARVDMSDSVVGNMLDPVTKEPMEIVQCYFRKADGTMELSHVAVHRGSRVVLPLPNEVLNNIQNEQH